ncbi:hypothetical protein [Kitasatospora sp. NPDC127060]|uniref:hypothetical protein n=1 Tax=Kitasatospora sp. NPDC127060 TaxID=3347121 RepID=UPI0036500456
MTDHLVDTVWLTRTLGAMADPKARTVDDTADAWELVEAEIAAARKRHGETERGPIWGAFLLLQHTPPLEKVPRLYRAHVREVLDRVATGQDTRPATDAELLAALSASSVQVPLSPSAACLVARLLARLPSGETLPIAAEVLDVEGYERLFAGEADAHARQLQARLTRHWRTPS